MPDRPWTDEYTLLCEKCGYVIEGLDQSGNCPECGKPIAESLPERRVGTPWQQSPGVKSLLATWWMTLRHPLRTLDVMHLKERTTSGLTARTLLISSSCMYLVLLLIELINPYSSLSVIGIAILGAVGVIILITVFVIFTEIELSGLRIISKSRGFRVTEPIAYQIVSHGSVGWVWCGSLLASSLYCLGQSVIHGIEMNKYPKLPWSERPYVTGYTLSNYYDNLTVFFFLLSILGFLFFETFAYLGLRRLKYANRMRPESPSQGATTRVEDAQ
ncbi:MAG: hypothetical protein CMJ35_15810 [Phycisphaerae bacterium]|nr:hypothetical protein [Phycisphaerae bacterium]MBM93053.1 hypothetical protein [Phycisphaerae bacterium]HCT43585.1 hypothetical protein [Phycisphaerales bacterium]